MAMLFLIANVRPWQVSTARAELVNTRVSEHTPRVLDINL